MSDIRQGIAEEAARIVCDELLLDYGAAKRKAAERLQLGPRASLPENARVHRAVIEYQRLFGGAEYHAHLRSMRETALRVMPWLAEFSPRLVGGAVSGAVTAAHHVQLHAFADKAEMLDIHLYNRSIRFEQDERTYRYPDGDEADIPLACFEVRGIGVDVAVFPEAELKRPPVNLTDGLLYQRLTLAEARRLMETG